jgi:class 3 adenylate cyclase
LAATLMFCAALGQVTGGAVSVLLRGVEGREGEGRALLPSGTVSFLFTDLEGSTRLWEEHPEAMRDALARHDALLRSAVAAHGGYW